MKGKEATACVVLLLVTLGQFAIDIYLPSLPAMVEDLHTNQGIIQLTLTFFLAGFSVSQLIYGPLSERFGRRKVLLFGLSVFIVGAIGASIAKTSSLLIGMRLVQGIGIGAANVLCRAILRDLYEGKELARKVSYLGILWVTSPLIAPVLGGYIEEYWGWRMNFVFLTCFVLLIWIWAVFFLPETKDPSQIHSIHPRTIAKNYYTLLSSRLFLGYVLVDFFLYGIFSSFYVVGPFLLQGALRLSPVLFGWMMLLISFGYMFGSFCNIYLIRHFAQKMIIWIGLAWVLILSGIMIAAGRIGIFSVPAFVLPMALLFCGMAFIFTNCIGGSLSIFPHLAGSASGLWGFLAYLGGSLATTIMTRIPQETQNALNLALGIQCLCAFFAFWWGISGAFPKKTIDHSK